MGDAVTRRRFATLALVVGATLALGACSYAPTPPKGLPDEWEPTPTPSTVPSSEAASTLGLLPGERASVRIMYGDCKYFLNAYGVILDANTIVTVGDIATNASTYSISLADGTYVTISKVLVDTKSNLAFLKTYESLNGPAVVADTDPSTGDLVTIYDFFYGGRHSPTSFTVGASTPNPKDASTTVFTMSPTGSNVNGAGVYDDDGHLRGVFDNPKDADISTMPVLIPTSVIRGFEEDPSRAKDQPLTTCK